MPDDGLIAGRYRVIERLGSGGMASVLLADDERLGRRVALKRLHVGAGPDVAGRFQREARLGASLRHPNVVTVFDVLQDEDRVTLVMEHVDGEDLSRLLSRGPLEPGRALEVLRDVADALDHAHAHGVVHRDVKPANVLVRHDGVVKLADLGIATGVDVTRVTRTGTALGSVAYMAPEQLNGERVTAAADVYALAAVAFEMLAGRKARTGTTPIEVMREVAEGPAPDLSRAWPEAPPAATQVLCAGMAQDPADRPASAGELVRRLEEALQEGQGRPPEPAVTEPPATADPPPRPAQRPAPPSRPARGGRGGRAVAVAALVAGVVAAGTMTWALTRDGEEAPDRPPERTPRASPPPARQEAGPAQVASAFYERAAADRFRDAWALAAPSFRAQLRGYDAFRGTFSDVRSIRFSRAEVTRRDGDRATVAIATTSVQERRTELCNGNVFLSRSGGSWLIERVGVTCRTA